MAAPLTEAEKATVKKSWINDQEGPFFGWHRCYSIKPELKLTLDSGWHTETVVRGADGKEEKVVNSKAPTQVAFKDNEAWVAPDQVNPENPKNIRNKPGYGIEYILAEDMKALRDGDIKVIERLGLKAENESNAMAKKNGMKRWDGFRQKLETARVITNREPKFETKYVTPED